MVGSEWVVFIPFEYSYATGSNQSPINTKLDPLE